MGSEKRRHSKRIGKGVCEKGEKGEEVNQRRGLSPQIYNYNPSATTGLAFRPLFFSDGDS